MVRRLNTAALRRQRVRRQASLMKDGFTPAEAEYYTGFNWPITKKPFPKLRRDRRREIKQLLTRGQTVAQVSRFFERQWARTNQDDLAEQLIDQKYQQSTRRLRRAA